MILTSHLFMKELIENTTTKAGLIVFACIFDKVYEIGRKVAEDLKNQYGLYLISIWDNGLCCHSLKRQFQKLPKLFYVRS
jgi:hypothetical protein